MHIALATTLPAPFAPAFMGWLRTLSPLAMRRPALISGVRRTVHEIAKAETVAITQPQGACIDCLEGTVWVTLDNDPRDVILAGGQSFCVDSDRRALVHALDAARVRIVGQT